MNRLTTKIKFDKIKGILIDFDGVIAKTPLKIIDAVYDDFKGSVAIPKPYYKQFYRIINGHSLKSASKILRKILGVNRAQDFKSILRFLKRILGINRVQEYFSSEEKSKTEIDPDFFDFIKCIPKEIEFKICSAKEKNKILKICPEITPGDIYPLREDQAKIFKQTFLDIMGKLKIKKNEWILIDDDPCVLSIAESVGIVPIMITNEIFTEKYAMEYLIFQAAKIRSYDIFNEPIIDNLNMLESFNDLLIKE